MRSYVKPSIAACMLLLVSCPTLAQSASEDRRVRQALDLARAWIEAERDYRQIPGMSAAIVHDQRVLWSDGFGFADIASRRAATSETIYSICSISKLFTSIAVMQLRDAGKLRLDDPVSRHLPWFDVKRTDQHSPEITIEGILTHSSGLPRESDFPYWTGPDFEFPSRDAIIQKLPSQQTLYPAETYYQYSNLGLTLAGEIVAAASGQPYDEYVRRQILGPLGLRNTTSEMPASERGGKLATGYSALRREGPRVPVTFFSTKGIAPAAGYASSVLDLARFASWQFLVLDRKGGESVLKTNTLRDMHRVHWVDPDFETTWGLGFSVWRSDSKTFVGHGGSCPGFRSHLLLKPDEKVATIIMANAQGVATNELAQRVYEIIAPALKPSKPDGTKEKPNDASLARYTGSYESGFGGETAIVEWEDGLAAVNLPSANPMRDLIKLKKVGDHAFRRVRKDDQLGETIVFEMGADGKPSRLTWHSNLYRRVR